MLSNESVCEECAVTDSLKEDIHTLNRNNKKKVNPPTHTCNLNENILSLLRDNYNNKITLLPVQCLNKLYLHFKTNSKLFLESKQTLTQF